MRTKSTELNGSQIESREAVIGRGRLTTSGIRFRGLVFYDPEVTSTLVRDFDILHRRRSRDIGQVEGNRAFLVEFEIPDENVLAIVVFNPVSGSMVHLPVWRRNAGEDVRSVYEENPVPRGGDGR